MVKTNWNTYTIGSWEELVECETRFRGSCDSWVFRGQSYEYGLQPVLERVICRYSIPPKDAMQYEGKVYREFKRRAHNYIDETPSGNDLVEWLALMRHYGAPTRLLDCTYSFFIATYFALETADKDGAIWAVNKDSLVKWARDLIQTKDPAKMIAFDRFSVHRDRDSFERLFIRNAIGENIIRVINPFRLNDRLTKQQGAFLCASDVTLPFQDGLKNALALQPDMVCRIRLRRLMQKETLKELRKMNIDRTTLFGGLQGFAGSLESRFFELGEMPLAGDPWDI